MARKRSRSHGWRPWPCRSTPSSARSRMFQVGSMVEVRSNDEGFQGAWYEATITRNLSKHRRCSVSYTTLVVNESSQEPLKEIVSLSCIRPRRLPEDTDPAFELHQCVEAFHNEGWWPGVVSKLPEVGENSLYSVCFPTTWEEFQFKASQLRRHLERVKGQWVPVEKTQEGVHVIFDEGTRVEVSRDRGNYGAAWFVGTVLKVIGKIYFFVEYENLRVGGNGTEMLLKEIVDMQYIRPSPPALEFTSFEVLDEVEGYYQDGWFAGVVSAILPRCRYVVKYKHKEEEMVLDHTSLRPCSVWRNGHWFQISQKQHQKEQTPRGNKSDTCRLKLNASKRSANPISVLTANDDNDGANRPNYSVFKRKKAGGLSQGLVESSQASKKSKKTKLVDHLQSANSMFQDNSGSLSISVPTFRNNDDKIAHVSEADTLNGKEVIGPSIESEVKASQLCNKLKKEHLLREQLQVVGETKSISRRRISHSRKKCIFSRALDSSNNDGGVAGTFGVVNLKDKAVEEPYLEHNSSQPSMKSDKGISLEKHLQPVDGTSADCGYKTSTPVGKCSTAAMMLDQSSDLVADQHHSRSLSCESTAPICNFGPQSQSTPLSRDLCCGQGISDVNGSNESIITGKVSSCWLGEGSEHRSEEDNFVHSPVSNKAADVVPTDWGNGKGDRSSAENTKMKRKQLVTRNLKRQGKNTDAIKLKQHQQEEIEEHRRHILSQKITFNDKKSASSDGLCLSEKQIDIMKDARVMPRIKSSILNADSLKNSEGQKSQLILKSFLSRGEELWSCANRLAEAGAEAQTKAFPSTKDGVRDHYELTLNGFPSSKLVEMERPPVYPVPTKSRSFEEGNVYDETEFSPIRLLSVNTFVEIEESAPFDPSPSGLSLSMEDGVADHSELTPCGSLSESPVGMGQAPCDPTPCGSLPYNEDIDDHDELIPNAVSSATAGPFVNKNREIRSCIDGLNENERGENKALLACFKESIALECDELAAIRSPSGRDLFKDGEMALMVPSPVESVELPSEKPVLPFTRKSEIWELVESKEVFHVLPQQPHFQPLLRCYKEFREGIAIGLMVTFANLVTDISSLRIVDSRQDFEEKFKALRSLASNGFNIQPVHARLEKLLELHSALSQSEGKKQMVGAKLLELEEKKEQNCLSMLLVEKGIWECERNLIRLHIRRASILGKINKNDSEIVNLKTSVQEAEEASTSAQHLFSAAVTAPW